MGSDFLSINFSQIRFIGASESEEMKRMSVTITVSKEVVQRLYDLSFATTGDIETSDIETKLQQLLIAEYQQ